MHILLDAGVLLLIDFGGKGHQSEVLLLNPLLQIVIFLINPGLEVILRLEKLLYISGASAWTMVGEGFEGAVGHHLLLYLCLEGVDLLLPVVDELL